MRIGPTTRLGNYHLTQLLGVGGMGEVYVATDERLGRTVAVKILRPEVMADLEHRHRFEREAKALAALNHPGIVTIYALEEIDDVVFFVMDLVEGRTLTKLIQDEGALSVPRILDIAIPIADAIAAAHKRGIAHRDIKPDNIIVGPRDRVTVLDFGLAKQGGVHLAAGKETISAAPTMNLDRRRTHLRNRQLHGARAGGWWRDDSGDGRVLARYRHLRDGDGGSALQG